ncbi:hypothetical protein DENIS_0772 [Desulfonema ishimotonii]|uniref:Fibronectin type-III domain-containing protein n=1 Tax=Desulfonema ishimotonii TaxID=45657 RepID=A0A401FS79_9BACT|nr:LamG-like jellyroll fold domain-containing protein [Desulfonema ishimotonii]GBC59831.1 hypothetical protein DENIS_0772 [Desulfonema ishimotonii]
MGKKIFILLILLCSLLPVSAYAGSATLHWEANSEADLNGYNIYYGETSRSYGPLVPVGNVTEYTLEGLQPGQTYYFAITAVDTSGNESGFSAEVKKTIAEDPDQGTEPPSGILADMIGGWLMKAGSGAVVSDISGNGHNGVFGHNSSTPDPVWQTDAKYGNIVGLYGYDWNTRLGNYIDLGPLDIQGEAMSVGIMFRLNDIDPKDGQLISKQQNRTEGGHFWSLGRYQDNRLVFNLKSGGTESRLVSPGTDLYQTGQWAFAVATYDGKTMRLYCNGQEAGTMNKTGAVDTDSAVHAFIGVNQASTQLYTTFRGDVAFAFVYERALSAGEISTIYQNGKDALTGTPPPNAPDTVPPTIAITAPTGESAYTTKAAALTLSGSASDNVGVTAVTWNCSTGGSGTATGTTGWSVPDVALKAGENLITVESSDAAGNKASRQLTVTYVIPDTTPPTVAITSPTDENAYTTKAAALTLSGSASDNVGVTAVTWSCSTGEKGTATGTTGWSVPDVALEAGENSITITAADGAGNTATQTLTVTYAAGPDLKPGLIAGWMMTEGSGAVVSDISGNGNMGVFGHNSSTPDPVWQTDTTYGNIVELYGYDWNNRLGNYIDLGALDVQGNAMSVGIMFRLNDIEPKDGQLISKQQKRAEDGHFWSLGRYRDNRLVFTLKSGGTESRLVSPGTGLYQTGQWAFAVATYDGQTMRLYCNGQEAGTMAKTGTVDTDSAIHAFIGVSQNDTQIYTTHRGDVAFAFVYDRALSPEEIGFFYQNGKETLAEK